VVLIASLVFANSKNENYVRKTSEISEVKNDSIFVIGKALFKSNCASCHYIGMDKRGTASALGGITDKRDKEWLYNYTRNSLKMLENGDNIAKSISDNSYFIMPSFENLLEKDLDNIYYFVEKRFKMSKNGYVIPIEFEFKMAENKRAKACNHILVDKKDILKVSVSRNRFWKFSCRTEKHKSTEWTNTTLKSMFEYDNSINGLIYLMTEYPAVRNSKNAEWDFE
jgi:mono/diheme cytochrome c family protein